MCARPKSTNQKYSNNKRRSQSSEESSSNESQSSYYEVETIKAHCFTQNMTIMLQIKWKGYNFRHNTWEKISDFYEDC